MARKAYKSKSIDHLGLVAGFCKEINLAEVIDNYLPAQSEHKHISYGQLVVAMILNGLGFTGRTLHMYPEYFSDKPIERLLGPNIKAEHINDDALGRCLEQLYEHDVSALYQVISEKVVQHLGLSCGSINLDSTSFHVDGDYVVEDDFKGIRLTRGYSRDHRPELNQLVLNLMTENQAGLPVYMQACSGNTADKQSYRRLVRSHISSLNAAQRSRYFIADAALYVAETIQMLEAQKQLFITRVPRTIKEAKAAIAALESTQLTKLDNGYEGAWLSSNYGDVQQRWLIIKSTHASQRELITFKKRLMRSTESSLSSFKKLCRQLFRCKADAQAALEKWQAKQNYVNVINETMITIKKTPRTWAPKTRW